MASQTTSSTPEEKFLRGRESRNKAIPVLPTFVGYALVLGKTSYISAKDLFSRCYTVWHSSITVHECDSIVADKLCSRVMFWNFASKESSENKLVFRFFGNQHCTLSFVDKTIEGIPCHLFSFFFLDAFGGETIRTATSAPFVFLLPQSRVMYQAFLKAGGQNCKTRVSVEEVERQPLSVHLFAKKRSNLS